VGDQANARRSPARHARWIEQQQQHHGLPYLCIGSMNRYRISEVEEWLRERYAQGGETADAD
jgi:hypothetical protein